MRGTAKNFIGAATNISGGRPERARHVDLRATSIHPLGQWLFSCSKWEWREGKKAELSDIYNSFLLLLALHVTTRQDARIRPGFLWTNVCFMSESDPISNQILHKFLTSSPLKTCFSSQPPAPVTWVNRACPGAVVGFSARARGEQ